MAQADEVEAILSEMVAERESQAHPLPDLVDEPSFFDQMLADFFSWLDSNLDTPTPSNATVDRTSSLFEAFLQVSQWAIVAVAIALICFAVFQILRSIRRGIHGYDAAATPLAPAAGEDDFTHAIERALAEGRFAEAARWRWRQYLVRCEAQPSRTPLETWSVWQQTTPALSPADATILMFGEPAPDNLAALYGAFQETLASLERRWRSADVTEEVGG